MSPRPALDGSLETLSRSPLLPKLDFAVLTREDTGEALRELEATLTRG